MSHSDHVYIYVDANIIQLSDVYRIRYLSEHRTLDWGGQTISTTTYGKYEIEDTSYEIKDDQLRKECFALRCLSRFDDLATIHFVQQFETSLEIGSLGNPSIFDAKVQQVDGPIEYSRSLFDKRFPQWKFVNKIDHPRLNHLKKVAGVQEGMNEKNLRSQVMDAWHLWCAERNECNFFLTTDYKLINLVNSSSKSKKNSQPIMVKLVSPLNLMEILCRKFPWQGLKNSLGVCFRVFREERRIFDLAHDGLPPRVSNK